MPCSALLGSGSPQQSATAVGKPLSQAVPSTLLCSAEHPPAAGCAALVSCPQFVRLCQTALQATSPYSLGERLALEMSALGTWVVVFPNDLLCRDEVECIVTKGIYERLL